jgi:bacteriorhodopsin
MGVRGNEALDVNPFVVNDRTVDIHITTRGSDWYWAVMSTMGTTMLVILGIGFLKPASHRIFHYILAAAAFVAMMEHYSMAANLGWVPIDVEWQRSSHLVSGVNRQIWWVRYCCWYAWPETVAASYPSC